MINDQETLTCDVKLFSEAYPESPTILNSVEYVGSLTPSLEEITPRFGNVVGGEEVTFTGTDFSEDISLYTIIIDGINCPATAANTTSVTCTTGKRPGLVKTSLYIYIEGKGLVSLKEKVFIYANYWSLSLIHI